MFVETGKIVDGVHVDMCIILWKRSGVLCRVGGLREEAAAKPVVEEVLVNMTAIFHEFECQVLRVALWSKLI